MESDEGLSQLSDNLDIEVCPTFTEYADKLCPLYMSMGVSYHDYWFGDYSQFKYYWEREEILAEKRNNEMFILGNYVYDAICCVAPVLVANPRKGAKVEPYHKKPYELNANKPKKPKEVQNDMLLKFQSMASRWNANFDKGGEKK